MLIERVIPMMPVMIVVIMVIVIMLVMVVVIMVMTLLVVGVAMPTPGQIGGFHAMYRLTVVTFFGVPDDTAVGAAIVLHAVSFVPVTIVGLVFMAREGLSFGRMREMAQRGGEAKGAPPSGVIK